METAGRVAVITGGASGIGRGMARAFAAAGMRLLLADLDDTMLAATVAELSAGGVEVASQRCDVSKLEDVEALAAAALDRFGAVHVLCNNAGIGIPTPTHNIRLEDWRWIVDVDLWGPIYGVKTFLPIMEAADNAKVTVQVQGRTFVLPRDTTGSGERYNDGQTVFWEHQGEALFDTPGLSLSNCKLMGPQ